MRNKEFFYECLMDGDAETKMRAKKLRGRALAAALTTEAAVIVVFAL